MNLNRLTAEIRHLSFSKQSLSPIENDYAHYYGIDFGDSRVSITHEMGYLNCHQYRIACHIYRQVSPETSKGTFFILHGYYDHVGLFKHIISYFLKQGYCIFAYDLPGHGLSTGKPASIPSFSVYSDVLDAILSQCTASLPEPWHAYGQSTGGAILTDYCLRVTKRYGTLPFTKVILSAPLVRPYQWAMARIQLYALRPFVKQLSRKFSHNSRDKKFLEFVQSDPLAPRILPIEWVDAMRRWIKSIEQEKAVIGLSPLIIQGTDDRTVDAKHNIAVLKRLYSTHHLFMLDKARHHLPNELKTTRTAYMSWLSSFL